VRLLSTAVVLIAALAQAQAAPEAAPFPAADPSFAQRCFAVPGQVWIPGPGGRYYAVNGATSAPLSAFHPAEPATSPPPSGGSGGGGIEGKALLVIAVVVVAALPVILYIIDDDAPAVVDLRFGCPSFSFDAVGGVDLGDFGTVGAGSGRFTFGLGLFGGDFQFDSSAGSISAWSGHLLFRLPPKSHLEPNLAVGFRTLALGGVTRRGLEVGVPHRYVLWREGLRQFSIELRPTFTFGLGSFDVGLEAAFLVPVIEPIHLRLGGKLQSFGNEVIGGVSAGLAFSL
jgi:hypothetical protein